MQLAHQQEYSNAHHTTLVPLHVCRATYAKFGHNATLNAHLGHLHSTHNTHFNPYNTHSHLVTLNTPSTHPQVLLDPKWPEKWPFRPEDFLRYDESGARPCTLHPALQQSHQSSMGGVC